MKVHICFDRRRGGTLVEFVVACSLLASLMLLLVPSAIRIGRVQRMSRHDRIAMDEVTNQLDRLSQLPLSDIEQELDTLTPSDFASAGLPNPKLRGTLDEAAEGYRLALHISWDSPGRNTAPLSMAIWLFPVPAIESIEE